MSENSQAKAKYRNSKEWKTFREEKFQEDSLDYITRQKLRKGYNLHHLDLDFNHYEDISNHNHFINVNKNTHKWIHQIFSYYKKDPEVLNRLKEILDKMIELNP